MGIFGQSSPFDADIEKATSEKNTVEPWGVIMDICDKIGSNPRNAKDALKSIMRRMGHNDPHVVALSITLLDACVNNCGKSFHLEVASRDFENEFTRLLVKAQPQIASKMRQLLKKWAEGDFKADPQLNLIPSLYQKLKSEGHDFSDSQKAPKTAAIPAAVIKDPNVVTSQQEEDDIAKAIELSLKETKGSPKKQPQQQQQQQQQQSSTNSSPYSSLYPWLSGGGNQAAGGAAGAVAGAGAVAASGPVVVPQSEPRKVRALYDFEAAEENELTFVAGEIIHVLDDTDPNWWKGYNQRGEGLFPSNFVTADLSVEPERLDINVKSKKTVQFDETKDEEKTDSKFDDKDYVPEINEEKIDRLLHLLHEANPEDPSQDSEEMLRLEAEVNKMGPLIDAELERVDRKHAQLTQLSSDLVDAINLYHTLMREPDRSALPAASNLPSSMNYMPPGGGYGTHHSNAYGTNQVYGMPPNMYHGIVSPTSTSMQAGMHMMPPPPGAVQSQQNPASNQQHQQPSLPQMPMMNNPAGNFAPQQMIPIQYQNGHQHSQHLQQPPQQQQQQQHHQTQPQHPMSPPQQLQNTIPSTVPSSSLPQQMMTQQQPQTHSMNPSAFHPPPHTSMGGFPSHPNAFVSMPPSTGNYNMSPHAPNLVHNNQMVAGMMPPPPPQQQHSMQLNHNPQMQLGPHQMAAINQPITHSLLGQNDSKTNIPIYQQQR